MAQTERRRTKERLPAEIFDLPVEKMRAGYYNVARAWLKYASV